jgi:trehalose 6-phosphate synthase/phosphatase
MPRLLLVSNRLPVTVRAEHGEAQVTRSAGGLAAGLRGPHERSNGLWIGWPGDVSRFSSAQRQSIESELARQRTVPVHLSVAEIHRYYDGFSNGVLWPLFHYLIEKVNLDARGDWDAYREVNERFAASVAARYRPGDRIWIHDYQLMLVPELLRKRLPGAKIGFFLHTPFPSADVFRILPWRDRLLRGLLGADVIGFHTESYRRHFIDAAARISGADVSAQGVVHEGRDVQVGVYPIGVDVEEFERLAADSHVQEDVRAIRQETRGRKIILGIDRLDYTKGIARRLLAIERFFEREPHLRGEVRFIQLAVPTREKVDAYADFRRRVNELVGRINGQFGTIDALPIHFLHRSMSAEQVAALYAAADVMLVTPLRDGMNLVAKEYVASRIESSGTLVLSEFAGAADELKEALHVNPYDIDSMVNALVRSITMPAAEQRSRMDALRCRVAAQDVHRWAESFLDDLEQAGSPRDSGVRVEGSPVPLLDAVSWA